MTVPSPPLAAASPAPQTFGNFGNFADFDTAAFDSLPVGGCWSIVMIFFYLDLKAEGFAIKINVYHVFK